MVGKRAQLVGPLLLVGLNSGSPGRTLGASFFLDKKMGAGVQADFVLGALTVETLPADCLCVLGALRFIIDA